MRKRVPMQGAPLEQHYSAVTAVCMHAVLLTQFDMPCTSMNA